MVRLQVFDDKFESILSNGSVTKGIKQKTKQKKNLCIWNESARQQVQNVCELSFGCSERTSERERLLHTNLLKYSISRLFAEWILSRCFAAGYCDIASRNGITISICTLHTINNYRFFFFSLYFCLFFFGFFAHNLALPLLYSFSYRFYFFFFLLSPCVYSVFVVGDKFSFCFMWFFF